MKNHPLRTSTLLAGSLICSLLGSLVANATDLPLDANANGVVRSAKTGATARVAPRHAATFQAYINDLEQNYGATVRFMGGIRKGRCWSGGRHPCGAALDVCQLSRGVVDKRCGLPSRTTLASIAERHGLFEGGRWCNSDYGHAQVGTSAESCSTRTLMAKTHRHRGQVPQDALAPTLQLRDFIAH